MPSYHGKTLHNLYQWLVFPVNTSINISQVLLHPDAALFRFVRKLLLTNVLQVNHSKFASVISDLDAAKVSLPVTARSSSSLMTVSFTFYEH